MKTKLALALAASPLMLGLSGCTSMDTTGSGPYESDSVSTVSGNGGKVAICHVNGNGRFHVIDVSAKAALAHLAHGDHYAGSWYRDADGDGHGDPNVDISECPGDGFVDNSDDCDDGDGNNFPGNDEACGDGADNDCDGDIDEGCSSGDCASDTYGGHTYLVCLGQLDFYQAADACAAEGLALARIDDQDENTWVVDLALAAYGCTNYEETSYWISNLKSETGTYWPSGELIWAAWEPTGDGNNVHLLRFCDEPYGWNDVPTTYTWGWVCESAD